MLTPKQDIIVIGASAGGVEALRTLTRLLPADLPAAVFIVLHFPPSGISHLPKILTRTSGLPSAHAVDGEPIQPGRIYIAPPDHHLVLRPGHVELSYGPKENRARPAIDVLFRTAAEAYGARVIAVILSGALSDGASGLVDVRRNGGTAIVQDPEEAVFPSMPLAAIRTDDVQHVLPLEEIAPLLVRLARDAAAPGGTDPMADSKQQVQERIDQDRAAQARDERRNLPALYTCPDCGGNLWEVDDEGELRFQCHVGHTLSADSMLVGKSEEQERYLWAGLRSTKERATLLRQLAARARQQHGPLAAKFERRMADRLEAQAVATDADARQIEELIEHLGHSRPEGEHEPRPQDAD